MRVKGITFTARKLMSVAVLRGGGKLFLESSSVMTGTFGEVFGPRNHTGSEPRPARK